MDYASVSRILATLSLSVGAGAIALLALIAVPRGRAALGVALAGEDRRLVGLAWLVAAVATAGSLYYSQVVGFAPCVLCWYQRIAMYPLVAILGVGAIAADGRAWRYGLPLSVLGLGISVYHIALQNRPALDLGACSAEVPCTLRYVSVFGFVSIPVMAAGGFLGVTALLLVARSARRAVDPVEPGRAVDPVEPRAHEIDTRPTDAPA